MPKDEPTPVQTPKAAPAAMVKKLTVNADVISFLSVICNLLSSFLSGYF
jgi:hypothetical protein